MGGYIRFDKDLPDDPRLMECAEHVYALLDMHLSEQNQANLAEEFPGVDVDFSSSDAREILCNAMLRGLVHLWTYADVHLRSDNSIPLSSGALARVMRLPHWVVHLYPVDWLVIDDEESRVVLPGFIEKTGIKPRDIRKSDRELMREKWAADKRRQRGSTGRKKRAPDSQKTAGGHSGGHPPPTGTGTVPLTNTGTGTNGAAARAGPDGPAAPRSEAETPEVIEQRRKLRGVVAGLRTKTAVKP